MKMYNLQRNKDFYFTLKEEFTEWSKLGIRKTLMLIRCSLLWGKNKCNCYGLGFITTCLKDSKTFAFKSFVSQILWLVPVIDMHKFICRTLCEGIEHI